MELITRIGINGVLIILGAFLLIRAIHKIHTSPRLPIICKNRALFQMRLIVIWSVMFLLMTWDWIVHGRMFLLPVQIELAWSAMMLGSIAIFHELIGMIDSCPDRKPLGEILRERGHISDEELKEALNLQSTEKKDVFIQ